MKPKGIPLSRVWEMAFFLPQESDGNVWPNIAIGGRVAAIRGGKNDRSARKEAWDLTVCIKSVWRWERRQDMGRVQVCPWLVPYSPLRIQKELSPNKYKGGCAWVSENAITWCGIPIVRCWLIFLCMESYFAALETVVSVWEGIEALAWSAFPRRDFFP